MIEIFMLICFRFNKVIGQMVIIQLRYQPLGKLPYLFSLFFFPVEIP